MVTAITINVKTLMISLRCYDCFLFCSGISHSQFWLAPWTVLNVKKAEQGTDRELSLNVLFFLYCENFYLWPNISSIMEISCSWSQVWLESLNHRWFFYWLISLLQYFFFKWSAETLCWVCCMWTVVHQLMTNHCTRPSQRMVTNMKQIVVENLNRSWF